MSVCLETVLRLHLGHARSVASLHCTCLVRSKADRHCHRESTSIPVNPRTGRPVGYAFVDLETSEDAEKARTTLSGKKLLERTVSVQVARKPEAGEAATEATIAEPTSGGEGHKRGSGRGRGRGRGRGGRSARGGRAVCELLVCCS